jgi:colicin import membrane protein
MPRLKVFRDHIGFYDTVVAAPSQKAALAAWGAAPHEFKQGFAKVTDDTDAIEAALAQPGVVLRRPFGTRGAFKADAELPKAPRLSAKHKAAAAKAARDRAKEQARAAREAARREKAARAEELREIEKEEAALRARRAALAGKKQHASSGGTKRRPRR